MPKRSYTSFEKFSSQADPELLALMRERARIEGRLFQSLLDEALQLYLFPDKDHIRDDVKKAFQNSLEKHHELYRKLALC